MVSLILLAVVVSYVVLVAYEFSWPPSIPREGVATFPLKAASVRQPGGLAEPVSNKQPVELFDANVHDGAQFRPGVQ